MRKFVSTLVLSVGILSLTGSALASSAVGTFDVSEAGVFDRIANYKFGTSTPGYLSAWDRQVMARDLSNAGLCYPDYTAWKKHQDQVLGLQILLKAEKKGVLSGLDLYKRNLAAFYSAKAVMEQTNFAASSAAQLAAEWIDFDLEGKAHRPAVENAQREIRELLHPDEGSYFRLMSRAKMEGREYILNGSQAFYLAMAKSERQFKMETGIDVRLPHLQGSDLQELITLNSKFLKNRNEDSLFALLEIVRKNVKRSQFHAAFYGALHQIVYYRPTMTIDYYGPRNPDGSHRIIGRVNSPGLSDGIVRSAHKYAKIHSNDQIVYAWQAYFAMAEDQLENQVTELPKELVLPKWSKIVQGAETWDPAQDYVIQKLLAFQSFLFHEINPADVGKE